ncbi:MAG: serine--tRNA ligase [Legionellales bacterium]|nr:serine--tRNA ligase [Legionellales bacterium]HBH10498.1 serine--tRNA ligase [Gammaproteobacteria bacterium]|tara:strand:- start:4187 stop:5464 length:1278 start_codon:yes stop_codon:yes gene_type:complete
MLDPQLIRNKLDTIVEESLRRGVSIDKNKIKKIEDNRKKIQVETEKLQSERNNISKKIGELKSKGEQTENLLEKVTIIKKQLEENEEKLNSIQKELNDLLIAIPNIPHKSVPNGNSDTDNKLIREWGEKPKFDFKIKDHVDLGESLNQIDFDSAVKVSGSRFVVLKDKIAQLHRALIQFMIETHTTEHGYQEINVPYLVNSDSCINTGQLPKFEEDLFRIQDQDLYLIPTAEIPVTNVVKDQIIEDTSLPLKYVCHSPCFRSEAGSYGKDTRGIIRQHQFEKVELVQIVQPENSYSALEELTINAEEILKRLNLSYRVVALCAGDLGFSAAKTYDIEVWLPSQNMYREISSCSNFESFQARRMQARYRDSKTNKPELLHTLNGSGLAVGRTLIAIMENYQTKTGDILIPNVLRQYMANQSIIKNS